MNISIHDHADEGDLLRYVDGELDELEVEEVERRIAECAACRDRYDDLAAASDSLTAFLNKADYPARTLTPEPRRAGGWWTSPLAKAAAVVLLLVGLGAPVGAFMTFSDSSDAESRAPWPAAAWPAGGIGSSTGGSGDVFEAQRVTGLLQGGEIDVALEIAENISSDFEAANVLAAIAGSERSLTRSQTDAVIRIMGTIASDAELGRLLRHMLEHAKLTPRLLEGMLTASLDISSDYELTEFLVAFTQRVPLTRELRTPYLTAVETVASDFESARLLEAYFTATGSEDAGSEMSLAEFEMVTTIAGGIASDTELSAVLQRLLDSPDLTIERADMLLFLSLGIASDFEMAGFLMDFNSRVRVDGDLRAGYMEALNTIGSDFQLAAVLGTYVENELSTNELAGALEAAGSISSDFELANLLVKVAQRHELRGEALRRFEDAAATISSDAEAARVVQALQGARR